MHDNFFFLGTITKTHGLKGGLVILLDTNNPEHYRLITTLYIEKEQRLLPVNIHEVRIQNNRAFVKLETIDSIEKAQAYLQASVYLPLDQLPKLNPGEFYYHEVVGYRISDTRTGNWMGIIESIVDCPGHSLYRVLKDEKELFIPAHFDYVRKTDRENKILYLELPEGLAELFTKKPGSEKPV